VLTYGEKSTNLVSFKKQLKIIIGKEYGDAISFKDRGSYKTYPRTTYQTVEAEYQLTLRVLDTKIQDVEENDQKKTNKILEKQREELNMAHMERSTTEIEAEDKGRLETWKKRDEKLADKEDKLDDNKPKIFSLILGNMSERYRQEVIKEIGAEEWLVLEEEKDPLTLWRAILDTPTVVYRLNNKDKVADVENEYANLKMRIGESPLVTGLIVCHLCKIPSHGICTHYLTGT
jgi:hypothetical protein